MKKLIIVLIFSLGLISCEKEEDIIIRTFAFENFEILDGLKVGNILMMEGDLWSWGEYRGENRYTLTSQESHNRYELELIKNDLDISVESCSINGELIDFEIWRVKVFNLYYKTNAKN